MAEYTPVLKKEQVASLLGRPLSKVETTNFNIYLEITETKLKDLLCLSAWPEVIPADLQLLIARAFGTVVETQKFENGITNKKVEDVSVSFAENRQDPLTVVLTQEAATVAKYSQCSAGIRHGRTIYDDRF